MANQKNDLIDIERAEKLAVQSYSLYNIAIFNELVDNSYYKGALEILTSLNNIANVLRVTVSQSLLCQTFVIADGYAHLMEVGFFTGYMDVKTLLKTTQFSLYKNKVMSYNNMLLLPNDSNEYSYAQAHNYLIWQFLFNAQAYVAQRNDDWLNEIFLKIKCRYIYLIPLFEEKYIKQQLDVIAKIKAVKGKKKMQPVIKQHLVDAWNDQYHEINEWRESLMVDGYISKVAEDVANMHLDQLLTFKLPLDREQQAIVELIVFYIKSLVLHMSRDGVRRFTKYLEAKMLDDNSELAATIEFKEWLTSIVNEQSYDIGVNR